MLARNSQRFLPWIFFLALTTIGVLRIINTWRHVSQTSDESPNIACGMQWVDLGKYDYGPFHPPLARTAIATVLYLHGLRAQKLPDRWAEGNAILHSAKDYHKALKWARTGILPFFVLACLWVWLWSRRLLGDWAAFVPVLILTNTPAVLAHAGLATTDMAVAAGVCGALFAFVVWLERPTVPRSLFLGLTFALAFLSKFSAVLFVPAGAIGIAAMYWFTTERQQRPRALTVVRLLGVVAVTSALLIWAAYGFSWGRTSEHLADDAGSQSGPWSRVSPGVLRVLESTPLPAPQILDGIWSVHNHNEAGHAAYLLGKNSLHGWWYFFPVALAIKTPLAMLLLAGIGIVTLAARKWNRLDWRLWAPTVAASMILVGCMPASLNIGVRYVLPIYPLLAIIAGTGCVSLWKSERHRKMARAVAALSMVWLIGSTVRAHPDYISYFNEIANSRPEEFLVDSDLDWGQDLQVLSGTLKRLNVQQLHMDCFYTGDGAELDLPRWEGLEPYKPVTGWVAVSFTPLKSYSWVTAERFNRKDSPYAWLNAYEPRMRVGRSILLFYIPENL